VTHNTGACQMCAKFAPHSLWIASTNQPSLRQVGLGQPRIRRPLQRSRFRPSEQGMLVQAEVRLTRTARDTSQKPDDSRIKIASSQPSGVEKDRVPVFEKLPAPVELPIFGSIHRASTLAATILSMFIEKEALLPR